MPKIEFEFVVKEVRFISQTLDFNFMIYHNQILSWAILYPRLVQTYVNKERG